MSQCRICGYENARFDVNRHQIICKECIKTTPHKLTRSEFDVRYWGENVITVPASTRKEFYEDYISSTYCFDDYKKQTTIASY